MFSFIECSLFNNTVSIISSLRTYPTTSLKFLEALFKIKYTIWKIFKKLFYSNKQFYLLIIIVFFANNCFAKKNNDIEDNNSINYKSKFRNNDTGIISADIFEADDEKNLFNAYGNVEIIHNNKILLADEIIYDKENHIIKAFGNVSLMDRDGNVIFADEIILDDDLKDGILTNFAIRFSDDSLLAAKSATRENDNDIYLDHVVYSPCKIDENDKDANPQWQIKAHKVIVKEDEETIKYRHAKFEFYGLPIFYSPYFSHPMPNANRRNGLLVPTYSRVTNLGSTVKLPYYINIAPNKDATITPFITSKKGIVLNGEYRHLIPEGAYELRGSITKSARNQNTDKDNSIRGHIEGAGYFNLDNGWNMGFSGIRSSDRDYLREYKFNTADILTSKLYFDKIDERNYTKAETISFQRLYKESGTTNSTPFILPHIEFYKYFPLIYKGSNLDLSSDFLVLQRDSGSDSNRMTFTTGVNMPHILKSGHYINFRGQLRGDLYYTDNVDIGGGVEKGGFSARAIPQIEFDWRYPMIKKGKNTKIFLEPIANLIISPYGGNLNRIPNEDSQDFELYDDNLFSDNRYTGFDSIEVGPRINYGLQGSAYDQANNTFSFLFGQSYKNKIDDNAPLGSGLESNFSDYVGRVRFKFDDYLDIAYRFRIDKTNFRVHRSEIFTTTTLDPFRFSINYLRIDPDTISNEVRKELYSSAGVKLSNSWSLYGNIRQDLSRNGGTISNGIGLDYDSHCMGLKFAISKDFRKTDNVDPSTSYSIKLFLKNLN